MDDNKCSKKYDSQYNKKYSTVIYNKLLEYYKPHYNKLINLDHQKNILNNNNIKYIYENSSINNFIDILNVQYNINVNKTETICSIFQIKKQDKKYNYAYLFSSLNVDKYTKSDKNKVQFDDIIKHNFISTSPNLNSADGEFRHRLVEICNLCIFEEYLEMIEFVEIHIMAKIENEDLDILYKFHNVFKDNKIEKLIHGNMAKSKLAIKLFIIAWLSEIYNIINKKKQININDDFYEIMYTKRDIKIFEDYLKIEKNKKIVENFIYDFTNINNISNNLELSQKIIPQSNYDFKNHSKLITSIGTELLINNIVTNLKYNLVSESYSIFHNWFFISKSDKTLYDNKNIIKLLEFNNIHKNILSYLYNTKHNLYKVHTTKNEKHFKNEKIYKKLLDNTKKNIKITENKLLMSDISTCFIFEYVGKSYFNYLKNENTFNKIFNNYDLFSKLLFDIVYSLYCLNVNGIIHGDLHLNNITINDRYKETDSHIMYNMNSNIHTNITDYLKNPDITDYSKKENDDIYLFKNNGLTMSLIDYSRSYILLKAVKNNILEKYKNKSRKEYIKKEKARCINTLKTIFPNHISNQKHKIDILFTSENFEIFFNYFSAIDIHLFCTNTLLHLKSTPFKYDKKIEQLLTNIRDDAYKSLEKITNDKCFLDETEYQSFPNYEILHKYFTKYKYNKDMKIKNISNVFNFNNINLKKYFNEESYHDFHLINDDVNIINDINNMNYNKDFKFNKKNNKSLEKFINNNMYEIEKDKLDEVEEIDSAILNLTNTLEYTSSNNSNNVS